MVPVVLRRRGAQSPTPADAASLGPIHYAVTADGIFEVRDTEIYRSEIKSTMSVPDLERGVESLEIRMPRLPAALMHAAVAFFAEVNRLCGGEGMLILFYDPGTQKFRAEAPPQLVRAVLSQGARYYTSLAVKYGVVARPAGYLRCGSIHSHAELAAYASGTDCDDELDEDGLHVVVGNFGRATLSFSAAFAVAGRRFTVALDDAIEPFDATAACSAKTRAEWIAASSIEFDDGRTDLRYLSLAKVAELVARDASWESRGAGDTGALGAAPSSERATSYDVTVFAAFARPAPAAVDHATLGTATKYSQAYHAAGARKAAR